MNTTELDEAIRISAFIPDSDAVFTAARLRTDATNMLRTSFSRLVVNARGGYWKKRHSQTTNGTSTRYRIPYRAVVGSVEEVRLGDRMVRGYNIFGDVIVFDTAPASGQTLSFDYCLRPSALVAVQTDGRVTAVDPVALTVTVSVIPDNQSTAVAIATGDKLDIVKPNGWHEVCVVGVASTIAGTVLTFPAGTDLTDVEVGDYVRAAEQTDWPCLPDDFHSTLADATAASVLLAKGASTKARDIAGKVAADMERLQDLITPRVKKDPPRLIPTVGILRGRHRNLPMVSD